MAKTLGIGWFRVYTSGCLLWTVRNLDDYSQKQTQPYVHQLQYYHIQASLPQRSLSLLLKFTSSQAWGLQHKLTPGLLSKPHKDTLCVCHGPFRLPRGAGQRRPSSNTSGEGWCVYSHAPRRQSHLVPLTESTPMHMIQTVRQSSPFLSNPTPLTSSQRSGSWPGL